MIPTADRGKRFRGVASLQGQGAHRTDLVPRAGSVRAGRPAARGTLPHTAGGRAAGPRTVYVTDAHGTPSSRQDFKANLRKAQPQIQLRITLAHLPDSIASKPFSKSSPANRWVMTGLMSRPH